MNDINDLSTRLWILRVLTGLNRKEFCQRYNLNDYYLTYLELGRLKITENTIHKLINAFFMEGINFSKEWVITGRGKPPKKIDESINPTIVSTAPGIMGEINIFKRRNKKSIVIDVRDNSMFPFYEKGDFIGGIFSSQIDLLIGQKCIIEVEAGIFIPRVLKKMKKSFLLCASNDDIESGQFLIKEKIDRIAKIVWHRKLF